MIFIEKKMIKLSIFTQFGLNLLLTDLNNIKKNKN